MFSIELKSGKVTVDIYQITVSEIRTLLNPETKASDGDAIMAKAVGMTAEELQKLPYPEYRKLVRFFWKCANDPLKDEDNAKNSPSESI